MSKNYEQTRMLLKDKLADFLDIHGIKKSKTQKNMYCCINPEHDDKNPSMHVYESRKGEMMFYCHGCHESGDIFVANQFLNGTPIHGYEFLKDNLKPLADHYGINFELRALTPEEIEEMNIRAIYGLVKDIISTNLKFKNISDPRIEEYRTERKLNTNEDITEYGLGYVPDYDQLIRQLMQKGITKEYLQRIADINPRIFNPGNLIFEIRDHRGQTVGFSGRNCYFNKEDGGSKYINTENNAVYNKGNTLYNLDRALKKRGLDKHASIYITEGYTDAIALDKTGLRAVAIGGTGFRLEHIALLQQQGVSDIVFVLDGDAAGRKNTTRALSILIEGIRNFRVRFITLPDDLDPDEYIRAYGVDEMMKLKHTSIFEWKLQSLVEQTDLDKYELAKQMIPFIVGEPSSLEKDRMCEEVADVCKINPDTIRKEVQNMANDQKIKHKEEKEAIIDTLIKNLRKSPDHAMITMQQSLESLKNTNNRYNMNIYDHKEFVYALDAMKSEQESADFSDIYRFWRWPRFEEKLMGSMTGKLMFLGAEPNAGKTAWMCNFIVNILMATEPAPAHGRTSADPSRDNNVSLIFHSIDDARYDVTPILVSILASEYYNHTTINNIKLPYQLATPDPDKLLRARDVAYATIRRWAEEGRLIIKDTTHGNTLADAQAIITTVKEQFPERRVIYMLDNTHNLMDYNMMEDDVKRITLIGGMLKSIAVSNKLTVVATVEYNKASEHTTTNRTALNHKIKGSKTLEYVANWVGHLLNELHSKPDETMMWFHDPALPMDERHSENRSPIVKMVVSKNKITGYKGEFLYYFLQYRGVYQEFTANDVLGLPDELRQQYEKQYRIRDGQARPARGTTAISQYETIRSYDDVAA